ncbi:polyketide cyclase/dehydrase [Chitinophaga agrisoli]|uniref:Polyketide cyclase/dehydrase n=1 Tax=Chitinophaga agrisoli TaxID=2607653 RepID=A0A5B2VZY7_9BACT|nr:SRPBCC family protein [Chitinophaga agrisoli]KAA2243826.1 polyketide cyclase/dehydrase [Chitinophaga agrisoli]
MNLQQTNNAIMLPTNENAAVYCQGTINIKASSETVWNMLTDINNWSKWMSSVSRSKINGALMPDTSFDWKAGGSKIHSILHTVMPFSNLGWTGKVYGIYAVHNWNFKEVDGITTVTVSESMEGWLTKVFKRSLNKVVDKDMQQSLEELKAACEKVS